MAYREPLKKESIRGLTIFCPPSIITQVESAIQQGKKVEMEHSSFNDPGPDCSKLVIDGKVIHIIPGY